MTFTGRISTSVIVLRKFFAVKLCAMSDTSFASVNQKNKFIDIIDDDWLQDCLSDDGMLLYSNRLYSLVDLFFRIYLNNLACIFLEIDAPKDFEFAADDDADEDEQQSNEDVWNDTGLGIFAEETDQQR